MNREELHEVTNRRPEGAEAVSDSQKHVEAAHWVHALLKRHGVNSVQWTPDEFGLIGVPRKWAAVIDDLSTAIQVLHAGGTLESLTFLPQEAISSKGKKR